MRIDEIRSNPDKNPRMDILDAIKQYRDRQDVFVSFTELNKLGINPKSKFATPLGIYAYPVKEIFDSYVGDHHEDEDTGFGEIVPFAGGNKYAVLFSCPAQQGFMRDFNKFTENDLDDSLDKMAKILDDLTGNNAGDDIISDLVSRTRWETARLSDQPKHKTPFGIFWFATMKVANMLANHRLNDPYANNEVITARIWNGLLRKLGFVGFCDHEGRGVIHHNEPTQAVFLSTTPLKIIAVLDNKRRAEKYDVSKMEHGKDKSAKRKLARDIHKWFFDQAFEQPMVLPGDYWKIINNLAQRLVDNNIQYANRSDVFKLIIQQWIGDQPQKYKYYLDLELGRSVMSARMVEIWKQELGDNLRPIIVNNGSGPSTSYIHTGDILSQWEKMISMENISK